MQIGKIISTIVAITLLASCGSSDSNIQENEDGTRSFHYTPLGWSIELPDNWHVVSEEALKHKTYASKQFYEQGEGNNEGNKIIFGIKKQEDQNVNVLYAYISANVDDHKAALKGILNQQYAQYTAPLSGYDEYTTDSSFRLIEIAGKQFYRSEVRVTAPPKYGGGYFEYTTYATMIDTLNFGASITSTNETDKALLTQLWETSIKTLKQ